MYILIFLIITAVLSEGEALLCEQCLAKREYSCTGEVAECNLEGGVCTKGIEYNILDGDVVPTAFRSCINDTRLCGQDVSLNAPPFTLKLYSECCQEDNCNCGSIEMPPSDDKWNNVVCKSCFIEGSYTCDNIGTINCTGNQKECIEFSGRAARPGEEIKIYSYYGCVTTGVCLIGFGVLPGSVVVEQKILKCTESLNINDDN